MNTRPDITYAVGVLSRYGAHPTLTTCKLIVYLMQYLRGIVGERERATTIVVAASVLSLQFY